MREKRKVQQITRGIKVQSSRRKLKKYKKGTMKQENENMKAQVREESRTKNITTVKTEPRTNNIIADGREHFREMSKEEIIAEYEEKKLTAQMKLNNKINKEKNIENEHYI